MGGPVERLRGARDRVDDGPVSGRGNGHACAAA
jgi:hypothetical protein